ncbi:MAG: AAA family ATPase [Spiroplasma sp.]|nr:AAA family ATPase [Spiroplasma sp.]
MITKINIKGFKSLKNAEVEFYTKKNIADKNKDVTRKHQLLNGGFAYTFNLAGLIGANATGKSSFLEAILIYKTIVLNHYFDINKPEFRFFFELEKKPKQFNFEYLIDDNVLKHEVNLNENFQITCEKLSILNKAKKDNSWSLIFQNNYKYSLLWRLNEISQYEKDESFNLNSVQISLIKKLFEFIKHIVFFNNNLGIFENNMLLPLLVQDLKYFFLNKNSETQNRFDLIKDLISAVDPNIIDFEYDQLRDEIIVLVQENDKVVKVLLDNISVGTKRFIFIMLPIILRKNETNFYLIDEIENSLHPTLIDTILRLFYFNDTNLNNSQLFFTTHNPYIFDQIELHNSCINISLYNSDENFAKLSNFNDYKRNDKLFSKNYILEIINSHPESNNIYQIYENFSNKKDESNLM